MTFQASSLPSMNTAPLLGQASKVEHYTDENAEEFHAKHNWRLGCQMGRTAGSATLECDTHHATLSLDIPILLRDI